MSSDARCTGLEFRAFEDDAWYSVVLNLEEEGCVLKLHYSDFPDNTWDRRFRPDFKDSEAIDEFEKRFRPASVQLQDVECRKVVEGEVFCVSCAYGADDLRFYDAVVEQICPAEHTITNGEELCRCRFIVLLKHGPRAGLKAPVGIENICMIQPGRGSVDTALYSFLDLSRRKLCSDINFISMTKVPASFNFEREKGKRGFSARCSKGTKMCRLSDIMEKATVLRNSEPYISGQDKDLGGSPSCMKHIEAKSSCFFILIENLETDLSPISIIDFIYRHTSTFCKAYVSPSLSSEAFTRGAIFTANQKKIEKLSSFLHSTTHLIVSSKGRIFSFLSDLGL